MECGADRGDWAVVGGEWRANCGVAGEEVSGNVEFGGRVKKTLEQMSEDAYLNDVFKKLYFKELSGGDEFVVSMWSRISPSIKHMLKTIGLKDCTPVGQRRRVERS